MKKINSFVFIAVSMIFLSNCTRETAKIVRVKDDLTAYVNPFIGTSGFVSWSPGDSVSNDAVNLNPKPNPFGALVFPGAAVPFGMVQLSPDCHTEALGWSAGYIYTDSSLEGFSHMHTSGNGMGFGHILLLPLSVNTDTIKNVNTFILQKHRATFSHAYESAHPGYYQVKLLNSNINVELTATKRVGIHQYRYLSSNNGAVLLDLIHGLGDWGEVADASLSVINDSTLTGSRTIKSGIKTFFGIRFSKPFKTLFISADSVVTANKHDIAGKKVKALIVFGSKAETLVTKVGISFVSAGNALNNIEKEAPEWSFEKYRNQAKSTWNETLGRIRIEQGKPEDLIRFYTALYHSNLTPITFCDADSSFLGSDGKVHRNVSFENYTFFSLWDTYRTLHPLHTIVQPERVNDYINSMLAQASFSKDSLLPNWCLASQNFIGMAGISVSPVIAEAYAKGFTGFDVKKAFHYLIQNLASGQYEGYREYCRLGYVPYDVVKMNVPKTLEYAFNDWNIALLGRLAGMDANEFSQRSYNYRNLFDASTGFFRPKNSHGVWKSPFDPRAVSHQFTGQDYMESNAWQYNWHVQEHPDDLIRIMGGNEKFTQKLDSLFDQKTVLTGAWAADVAGLIGQYAQGNQPDHHAAYLYCFAGKPWKTQQRIRQIINTTYSISPDGLPGNDDGGEMSAWLVFSSLGFYPLNPASCIYIIGSPCFEKSEITISCKKFIVKAQNVSDKNIYIQSASLNGKPLKRAWITHSEIRNGGSLDFVMGAKPNKDWAKEGIPDNEH